MTVPTATVDDFAAMHDRGFSVRVWSGVCRLLARDTLPVPLRHLDPRVGKPFIDVERMARRIGSLQFLETRHDGRVSKDRYLYIAVLGTAVFRRFGACQHLDLADHFAVALSGNEFVRDKRADEIRIVLPLRAQPKFFESRHRFLRFTFWPSLSPLGT